MLYCLMDGHARTSTELYVVAEVSPSTASVHLNRLRTARLVKLFVQGKHRFYSLEGPNVAGALEGLSVLAGRARDKFVPGTPSRLRTARTCYDHMAGAISVVLHDRFKALGWLSQVETVAATHTTSRLRERKRSRPWALTSKRLGCCADGSPMNAWIGASGGLTLEEHLVRLF
jgi:DNA-binding transcriptional ArsR family regulator